MKTTALIVGALLACVVVHAQLAAGSVPAEPKMRLYVLPLAFSPESEKNYATWIKRLAADGLGNAVWQEIEEVFYDHPRYVVLQSPVTNAEFLKILAARQAGGPGASAGDALYDLPDKVITLNTNFFTRADATLAWGKASRREEFHVTVYLRYYNLAGGKLNEAVPAQADAVGPNPILASRQATRDAVVRLLARLDKSAGLGRATP